jgi:DNA polymerase-4/DNA polymerase V
MLLVNNSDHINFPRAILHIDGDSFFAACEVARRPDLRGKPVVTGLEKGIASAMSTEAKKRGITRAMRIHEIKKICPDVVILPSDYDMYRLYAQRMYAIVKRYTDIVEEYSIDECFADLTEAAQRRGVTYEQLARTIQDDLHRSLGITFSVGVGVNKVTAKIASKWNKPAGFTMMGQHDIQGFLKELKVGKLWGIGRSTAEYLNRLGIKTALDFSSKDRAWVSEHCDRPAAEIYEELNGHFVKALHLGAVGGFSGGLVSDEGRDFSSIQRTRTFKPSTNNRTFIWSQLSHHIEDTCIRLREHDLFTTSVSFFMKTTDFEYLRQEVRLPQAMNAPQEVIRAIEPHFKKLFRSDLMYRASGVSFMGLCPEETASLQLFGESTRITSSNMVTKAIDTIARKFGKHTLFLGSSLNALTTEARNEELDQKGMHRNPTGISKKRLNIIFLGEVR